MTPCKTHKEYNCANCGQDNVPECECGISGNFEECPKHKLTERKPVAWVEQDSLDFFSLGIQTEQLRFADVYDRAFDKATVPLYTSPLTQDEMRKVLEALENIDITWEGYLTMDCNNMLNSAIAILKGMTGKSAIAEQGEKE